MPLLVLVTTTAVVLVTDDNRKQEGLLPGQLVRLKDRNQNTTAALVLLSISLTMYGLSRPEAPTNCCGQRPQHSLVTGKPTRGMRPPQLVMAWLATGFNKPQIPVTAVIDGHIVTMMAAVTACDY